MVLDTSALVAVLFDEPERDEFVHEIAAAPRRLISSGTVLESSIVVESRRGEVAGRELDLFLHRAKVQTVAVDAEQVEVARAAWRRYGKGRHPAALNFGDLFAYALSRVSGEELLFKGDDFPKTDVAPAR
ncbi:type II toxin-antitoxin system VapC family toxin [Geodermatophilus sp. DF01-2]|uniref:type II toxin-antitoxin system VapC family toxin n=1 Tax=Geodermatophilus sp. DF01-2 TaxID=2559610 RepID=UPI0010731C7D|nr:type II toxin-antitoxin system VapC family toxin [Geodermatophilus sp. DF01_2]TFV55023.1 type II toxin-antitoxin system VapC family toxin [Geodermatophilus sp. DF01_2]